MTDHRSEEAKAWRKLYKGARWRALRHRQLMFEPLCRFCIEAEDVTAADVVDHIKAHKGNMDLFFDPANLQSLCKSHHDGAKQRIDKGQNVIRYGADGWPL
ncbi:HNH endonuclease [Sinorhizobium meliloti]|uniref:HNH endonuclease n=1 Tax=Rhizobium meliloti TaxID=382 RepID=UPI000FD7FABD|nr:HNH endonuclease [Sinorhizobium meliloti]RVN04664.1 HNH endonuclease [Sinorhizobium meliloti]